MPVDKWGYFFENTVGEVIVQILDVGLHQKEELVDFL